MMAGGPQYGQQYGANPQHKVATSGYGDQFNQVTMLIRYIALDIMIYFSLLINVNSLKFFLRTLQIDSLVKSTMSISIKIGHD